MTMTNIQNFSDFAKSKPFCSKCLSGFDIPTQRIMMPRMFATLHNHKIRDAVIKSVPVDVMDYLRNQEFTPEEFFHNEALLNKTSAINGKSTIPIGINPTTSLIRTTTKTATKIDARAISFSSVDKGATITTMKKGHDITPIDIVFEKEGAVPITAPSILMSDKNKKIKQKRLRKRNERKRP